MTARNHTAARNILAGPPGVFFFGSIATVVLAVVIAVS